MSNNTAFTWVGPLGFGVDLDKDGDIDIQWDMGDGNETWEWFNKEQAISIVNILIDRFNLTAGKPNAD